MNNNQINTYSKGEPTNKLTFIDLFAGIGGFRLGMTRAGFTPVGWCEIDKHAQKTYRANFNTEGEWFADDITKIEPREMPDFDILCGGFPCQAFSIAGKRRGFSDTRGTLFFEVARIAKEKQPRFLFLENVKGLLSHNKGETFLTILSTLDELGYDCQWQVLNSKDFGVPQNRERVFIVGHLRGTSRPEVFPFTGSNPKTLTQLVGGRQGYRVYDINGTSCTLASEAGGMGTKTGLYATPVLTPDFTNKKMNKKSQIGSSNGNMFTIDGTSVHGVLIYDPYNKSLPSDQKNTTTLRTNHFNRNAWILNDSLKIRRLTPLECFRLQGFPDSHFKKAKQAGLSDSQLYKQAGNAVTVNVIEAIARRLNTWIK